MNLFADGPHKMSCIDGSFTGDETPTRDIEVCTSYVLEYLLILTVLVVGVARGVSSNDR